MLFILAYSLLRAIINPDDFSKGDYSFPNIIKNVIISIIKDRIFGSTKEIPVYYDKIDRRFYSNYEEFDRIYGWDKKRYTDKLSYPIITEVFPDQ